AFGGEIVRRRAWVSLLCAAGTPALAQWLNYPTAGVPRLPDGKPNLADPVPKTAGGKPELAGTWSMSCPVGNGPDGIRPNGIKMVLCAPEIAVARQFGNIGQGLKDGLPYQPWAAELVKTTRAAN